MTHTERIHSSTSGGNSSTTQSISEHDNLQLQTFQYTDHNLLDMITTSSTPSIITAAITLMNNISASIKMVNDQFYTLTAGVWMQMLHTSRIT